MGGAPAGLEQTTPKEAISRIRAAIDRHIARRGTNPAYIVTDSDTFLLAFHDLLPLVRNKSGRAWIFGIEIVVIQTDGLPMIQAVAIAYTEATR